MALATIESKRVCIQKMFVWKFDQIEYIDMKNGMQSEKMTAIDPYDGKKYTGVFKVQKMSNWDLSISVDINPTPGTIKYHHYFNEDLPAQSNVIKWFETSHKLCVYVDVYTFRNQYYQLAPSLCGNGAFNTLEKLKQLWKDDPSAKFFIKCKGTTIEAIKPIMTACSPVFKAMFDLDWKESIGNSIEITDFDPDVVQKMVDFCENGTLDDLAECDELYKIADKYDIPELMKLALAKFTETTNIENVRSRLQMARQFEMEELKKWCIRFCVQNNIYDF